MTESLPTRSSGIPGGLDAKEKNLMARKENRISPYGALALFSKCISEQSPQSFSDWCGCSIKDAIAIFSCALACEKVPEDSNNGSKCRKMKSHREEWAVIFSYSVSNKMETPEEALNNVISMIRHDPPILEGIPVRVKSSAGKFIMADGELIWLSNAALRDIKKLFNG